jgi:tRNA (guanine-N1)-methyltransferase
MKIGVVSLFPGAFDYLFDSKKSGLVGELLKLDQNLFIEDLRLHGIGKHQVVDSAPYGGGDGMIFRPEPLKDAFTSLSKKMGVALDQSLLYTCWVDLDAKKSGGPFIKASKSTRFV